MKTLLVAICVFLSLWFNTNHCAYSSIKHDHVKQMKTLTFFRDKIKYIQQNVKNEQNALYFIKQILNDKGYQHLLSMDCRSSINTLICIARNAKHSKIKHEALECMKMVYQQVEVLNIYNKIKQKEFEKIVFKIIGTLIDLNVFEITDYEYNQWFDQYSNNFNFGPNALRIGIKLFLWSGLNNKFSWHYLFDHFLKTRKISQIEPDQNVFMELSQTMNEMVDYCNINNYTLPIWILSELINKYSTKFIMNINAINMQLNGIHIQQKNNKMILI